MLPIIILLGLVVLWYVSNQQGRWPIEPMHADHPIANTLGEVVMGCMDNGQWGAGYQHAGVDILAEDSGSSDPPYVVNIADGYLFRIDKSQNGNMDSARILSTDCQRKYIYTHLDRDTMPKSFTDKLIYMDSAAIAICSIPAGATPVAIGERIGQVEDAYVDATDHLHLQVETSNASMPRPFLNPLADIWPDLDPNSPLIANVYLAEHGTDPWAEFSPGSSSDDQRIVHGDVDIVARLTDRDDAGSPAPAASNILRSEV